MTTTPAGWYPDPENTGQSRWWDGASWTEHRSAPYALNTSTDLRAPEGVRWNTVWIWLVVVLPYIPSFGIFTIDWSRMFDISSLSSGSSSGPGQAAMLSMMLSPGYLFAVFGGMIAYGLSVWFAYLDRRELERRGVPRPFHWAWAFLTYAVYPIGRSVVVRRRTGHGISPMWVSIALMVLSLILGIVYVVYAMSTVFTQIGQYSGSLTP